MRSSSSPNRGRAVTPPGSTVAGDGIINESGTIGPLGFKDGLPTVGKVVIEPPGSVAVATEVTAMPDGLGASEDIPGIIEKAPLVDGVDAFAGQTVAIGTCTAVVGKLEDMLAGNVVLRDN